MVFICPMDPDEIAGQSQPAPPPGGTQQPAPGPVPSGVPTLFDVDATSAVIGAGAAALVIYLMFFYRKK